MTLMTLTTDHEWDDCPCTAITRVIAVRHPIKAEIRVRWCAEYTRTPVLSAMDTLAGVTGRHIIGHREALSLIECYSNGPASQVLDNVECVTEYGFSRKYYVKRDILAGCLQCPKQKCVACGERNCVDVDHGNVQEFFASIRMYESGQVYFLLHMPTKYLKVGYSATPVKRLQSHRSSIPGDMTTLGVVPGGRYLESAVHEELDRWLVPGHKEWFFYTPAVREYVERIVSVYESDRIGKKTVCVEE